MSTLADKMASSTESIDRVTAVALQSPTFDLSHVNYLIPELDITYPQWFNITCVELCGELLGLKLHPALLAL